MAAGPRTKMVVKNTFLDVFDDQPLHDDFAPAERRPRAHTDITDLKAPRKVSYDVMENTTLGEVPESLGGGPAMPHAARTSGRTPMSLAELTADTGGLPGPMPGSSSGSLPFGAGFAPSLPGSFPPGYGPPGMAGLGGLPGIHPWSPLYAGGGLPPYPGLLGAPGGLGGPAGAPPNYFQSGPAGSSQPYHVSAGLSGPRPNANQRGGRGGRGRGAGPSLEEATPGFKATAPGFKADAVPSAASGRTGRGGRGRGAGRGRGEEPPGAAAKQAPEAKPEVREELPLEQRTTVMLRNIPNRYTQDMLVRLLDEKGFAGAYDFVYLPTDFRNGVNLGYAFVNTLRHEDALRVTDVFQSFAAWCFDSAKVCEVSWAHPHQGLAEHVERYRNSPVMHPTMPEEYKPMVFQNGARVAFPAPTKAIRAPKLRVLEKAAADKNAAAPPPAADAT